MDQPAKPASLFIIAPVLLMGVLGLAIAGWTSFKTWSWLSTTEVTSGTVTALVQSEGARGKVGGPRRGGPVATPAKPKASFAPEIEYRVGEHAYRTFGNVYSSPASYKIGDQVTVRYEVGEPSHGHLDSFSENWFLTIFVGGFGLAFTIAGVSLEFARRRAAVSSTT